MKSGAYRIFLAVACLPVFALTAGPAQTDHAYSALAGGQSAAGTTTIRTTTRLVYEDVLVRDGQGRIVHGLTQKDFKLEEDGAPQQIDYFDESVHAAGTGKPAVAAATSSGLAAIGVGKPVAEFSNASATDGKSGAVNIILFDLLDTPLLDQLQARRELLKFLADLPPGEQVALYVLGDRLRMYQNFTSSSDRLIEAAKSINPKNFMLVDSKLDQAQANDFVTQFAQAIGGHDPGGAASALKAQNEQTSSYALGNQITSALGALNEIALSTSGFPGRKNLLWLSETFPVTVGVNPEALRGGNVVRPDDARQTTNLLSTAQISVYPISLLGLESEGVPIGSSGLGSVSLMGGPMGSTMHPQANDSMKDAFNVRAALRAGMNDLAYNTGGEAFVGTNDFAGALRMSMLDGSNYYTLAYQPKNSKWDGRFRKIHVQVAQKGYTLTYRRGYFAIDSAAAVPDVQALNAALQPGVPEATMLMLKARVGPAGLDRSGLDRSGRTGLAMAGLIQVASTIDPSGLELITTADGHKRGQIRVLLVALDETSEVDQGGTAAPPQTTSVLNLDFDPALYPKLLASGIGITQQLKLKPGRYRLRLGVEDLRSHRLGTLDMPMEIPAGTSPAPPATR